MRIPIQIKLKKKVLLNLIKPFVKIKMSDKWNVFEIRKAALGASQSSKSLGVRINSCPN